MTSAFRDAFGARAAMRREDRAEVASLRAWPPYTPTPAEKDLRGLTGADLAKWRAGLGLTQQAAADRLGVRQGTVSKAESRETTLLGPGLGQALAQALSDPRRSG